MHATIRTVSALALALLVAQTGASFGSFRCFLGPFLSFHAGAQFGFGALPEFRGHSVHQNA